MLNIILYNNYFKKHYYIKKMLINCKVDILTNKMKNLNSKNNLKINDDYYNDNTRNLDNLLYKYIKYDITLDKNDYKFLKKEHINDEFIINRVKLLKHNKILLDKLLKYPYIEQCTDKWYEIRKTCLTASDLGEALSKNNNLLAKKKAGVYIDNTNFQSVPPLKWGNMFEDMAIRCYKQRNNNINIHKFGLIKNNAIEHFGASPDGITDLGIMVEIKCPYSRKLKKDYIPEKYYYQIQGQLAVCNLKECDYVECYFETFDTDEDFLKYIIDNKLTNKDYGVIGEIFNKDINKYEYIYSDEFLDGEGSLDNIKNSSKKFTKIHRWVLKEIYVQKVNFNRDLWLTIPEKINNFWHKVELSKSLPIEYKNKQKNKFEFIKDDDN